MTISPHPRLWICSFVLYGNENKANKLVINKRGILLLPMKLMLHFSFFAPACVILLFLRPVVEQIQEVQIVTYEQLRAIRILIIYLMVLARVYCSKKCLQTFLDQPKRKIMEYKKEPLKDEERQRKVANFASYTCTTTLQYYLPMLIVLSTALLLKNFGEISLLSLLNLRSTSNTTFHRDNVTKLIVAQEVQEPLWTLVLTTFLGAQFLAGLIGIIGRRT